MYGLLLITLISAYLLSAFISARWIQAVQVALFVVAALLALRSGNPVAMGAVSIWTGLLLLLGVLVIVHRVISFTSVTAQSIYGALSAYLLIGLMFAAIYAAIDHLGGDHAGRPAGQRLPPGCYPERVRSENEQWPRMRRIRQATRALRARWVPWK